MDKYDELFREFGLSPGVSPSSSSIIDLRSPQVSGEPIDLTEETEDTATSGEASSSSAPTCVANIPKNGGIEWEKCPNHVDEFAPYCHLHTPVKIGPSALGGMGVFSRGWSRMYNGYPHGELVFGTLEGIPPNTVVGDYTVGTTVMTEEERTASNSDYIMTVQDGTIYNADDEKARRRGQKIIAAMLNDCLPVNALRNNCQTNTTWDNDGKLITGRYNHQDPDAFLSDPPIYQGKELFSEYGNQYWRNTGYFKREADYLRERDERYYPHSDQYPDEEEQKELDAKKKAANDRKRDQRAIDRKGKQQKK